MKTETPENNSQTTTTPAGFSSYSNKKLAVYLNTLGSVFFCVGIFCSLMALILQGINGQYVSPMGIVMAIFILLVGLSFHGILIAVSRMLLALPSNENQNNQP